MLDLPLWFFWWCFYIFSSRGRIQLVLKWGTPSGFRTGVGYGSNTKAELLGLWALLLSSQMMGIPLSHIFGDSQVIINWAKGSTVLSPPELLHWCRESQKLISSFQDLSFSHIYYEHNRIADHLSKTALSLSMGFGCYSEFMEDHLVTYDTFQLFWFMLWGDYSSFGFLLCYSLSGFL